MPSSGTFLFWITIHYNTEVVDITFNSDGSSLTEVIQGDEKKWIAIILWYLRRDYHLFAYTHDQIKSIIKKAPKLDLKKMGIVSKECKD